MDNITLPLSLGIIVWNELEKKGVNKRMNPKTGMLSFEFSQEELDSIQKLNLTNLVAGSLRGISNLRNLKALSIGRTPIKVQGHRPMSGIFVPQDHYTLERNVPSISDKDITEIEKIENLGKEVSPLSPLERKKLEVKINNLEKERDLLLNTLNKLKSVLNG